MALTTVLRTNVLHCDLQTEFGEDRCTQFRVIVVTAIDLPTYPDRTDYSTLRRSYTIARSVIKSVNLLLPSAY